MKHAAATPDAARDRREPAHARQHVAVNGARCWSPGAPLTLLPLAWMVSVSLMPRRAGVVRRAPLPPKRARRSNTACW